MFAVLFPALNLSLMLPFVKVLTFCSAITVFHMLDVVARFADLLQSRFLAKALFPLVCTSIGPIVPLPCCCNECRDLDNHA